MPALDIRTLTTVIAAVAVVLFIAQVLSWRVHQSVPGTRHWAVMTLSFLIGFALLAARSALPDTLSIVVANLVLLMGALLGLQGMRLYQGRSRSRVERAGEVVLLAAVALGQSYFTYVDSSYRARVILVSTAIAIVLGAAASELLRGGAPQTRAVRFMTGLPFAMVVVVLGFRVLHFATAQDVGDGFMASTRWQSGTFLAVIVASVAWTLGLLLLAAQHVELELRQAKAVLEEQATTDALTQINNRRAFLDLAETEVARAIRHQTPLAVIMFDFDFFKNVNDTHGHAAGDQVLQHAVTRCGGALRAQDIFGRLGGEEFAIVAPETEAEGAVTLAERLRRTLANEPIQTSAGPIDMTASFGVSSLAGKDTIAAVLGCADEALYRAKAAGRNRVEFFDDLNELAKSVRNLSDAPRPSYIGEL